MTRRTSGRPTWCCSTRAACAIRPSKRPWAKWGCKTAAGHRAERPGAPVVYRLSRLHGAGARRGALLTDAPGVDLVVGTQKFHRVAEHVERAVDAKRERARREQLEGLRRDDLRFSIVDTGEEAGSQDTIREHVLKPGQASAFVSIMQGCNMHCTFCIVPAHPRGRALAAAGGDRRRSPRTGGAGGARGDVARPDRESLRPARVSEIRRRPQPVRATARRRARRRRVGAPAVHVAAPRSASGAISWTPSRGCRSSCSHVHFPDAERQRPYPAPHAPALHGGALRGARRRPAPRRDRGMALTTDIIVGFPGETDEDYAATRASCERVGFDNAFVFRYSPRRDTLAATMTDQVPEPVKAARNQDLLAVVDAHARRAKRRARWPDAWRSSAKARARRTPAGWPGARAPTRSSSSRARRPSVTSAGWSRCGWTRAAGSPSTARRWTPGCPFLTPPGCRVRHAPFPVSRPAVERLRFPLPQGRRPDRRPAAHRRPRLRPGAAGADRGVAPGFPPLPGRRPRAADGRPGVDVLPVEHDGPRGVLHPCAGPSSSSCRWGST